MKTCVSVLLAVAIAIVLPRNFFALGQSGGQLSRVRGTIKDPSGAVMPGVDIVFLQGTTLIKATKTDEIGNFSVELNAGEYRFAATAPDFETHAQTLRVTPNMPSLAVTLSLEGISSTIDVNDNDKEKEITVDASTSLDATVLTEEDLKDLPDDEEQLLAYLQLLAGGEGNAQIVIDGFEGGRMPTRDQIAQIVIEPNSFNANGTGPRITITSREPGPARWAGNASFQYRDAALNARTPGSANKPPSRRSVISTNYNGPVIRGKWGLSINLSKQQSESGNNAIRAVTPDGPIEKSFVSPSTYENINLTNNLYLSRTNSLLVNVGYNRNKNLNGGIGGFTLEERASDNKGHTWNLQVSDNLTISPKMTTTFQFRMSRNASNTTPRTTGVAINVLDAFNGGGAQSLSNSSGSSYNVSNILRWTPVPKWNFQFAVNANFQNNYSFSQNNYLGTFTFSSLEDYLAGTPLTFTQTFGNPEAEFRHADANASLQATYRIKPTMSFSMGAQYAVQTHFRDANAISPTAQLQFQLKTKTTISLGTRLTHPTVAFPIFYYEQLIRGDGSTQQFNTVISNPGYPDPFSGGSSGTTSGVGASLQLRDGNLESPYTLNSQISVNQQFAKNWRLTTSFSVNRGVHQIRNRNINAPYPGTPLDESLTRDEIDQLRPFYPTVGRINRFESVGNALSKSLTFTLQVPSKKILNTQLSGSLRYGLSFGADDNSAANPYDVRSDWARNDQRHQFQTSFSIRPPKAGSLSFNINANSGRAYSITTGRDDNFDQSYSDRPLGISRNSLRGPGGYTVNLSYTSPPINFRKKKAPPTTTPPTGGGPAAPTADAALDSLIQSAMAAGLPLSSIQSLITAISSESGFISSTGASPATQPSLTHPAVTFSANVQNLLNNTRVNAYSGVITSPLFGKPTSFARGRDITLSLNTRF